MEFLSYFNEIFDEKFMTLTAAVSRLTMTTMAEMPMYAIWRTNRWSFSSKITRYRGAPIHQRARPLLIQSDWMCDPPIEIRSKCVKLIGSKFLVMMHISNSNYSSRIYRLVSDVYHFCIYIAKHNLYSIRIISFWLVCFFSFASGFSQNRIRCIWFLRSNCFYFDIFATMQNLG